MNKAKVRMLLELQELHAQQINLHKLMLDELTNHGMLTQEYCQKALLSIQYEARQAELLWLLNDIMDSPQPGDEPPTLWGKFN